MIDEPVSKILELSKGIPTDDINDTFFLRYVYLQALHKMLIQKLPSSFHCSPIV